MNQSIWSYREGSVGGGGGGRGGGYNNRKLYCIHSVWDRARKNHEIARELARLPRRVHSSKARIIQKEPVGSVQVR